MPHVKNPTASTQTTHRQKKRENQTDNEYSILFKISRFQTSRKWVNSFLLALYFVLNDLSSMLNPNVGLH